MKNTVHALEITLFTGRFSPSNSSSSSSWYTRILYMICYFIWYVCGFDFMYLLFLSFSPFSLFLPQYVHGCKYTMYFVLIFFGSCVSQFYIHSEVILLGVVFDLIFVAMSTYCCELFFHFDTCKINMYHAYSQCIHRFGCFDMELNPKYNNVMLHIITI